MAKARYQIDESDSAFPEIIPADDPTEEADGYITFATFGAAKARLILDLQSRRDHWVSYLRYVRGLRAEQVKERSYDDTI